MPSPIARNPADSVISRICNSVNATRPAFLFDPHFADEYPVMVPGQQGGTGQVVMVNAEEGARYLERGLDFKLRERLDFEAKFHRVTHDCVTVGDAWTRVSYDVSEKVTVGPKKLADNVYSLAVSEEVSYQKEEVRIDVVPDCMMLRSRMDVDDLNDLDWLAELRPETADRTRQRIVNREYFLVDPTQVDRFARATVDNAKPEPLKRADASIKLDRPESLSRDENEIYDVWVYRFLRVPVEVPGQPAIRIFSMLYRYHHGVGDVVAAWRNPYEHQERIHTHFRQYLDGASTVSLVRYAQELGTHLIQSELKNALLDNNLIYWYDPYAPLTSEFFRNRVDPITAGMHIPGVEGKDWGIARGGATHYSLLGLITWNAGTSQETAKVSDYEQGASVPSHVSPSAIQMLLDRGGQSSVLFLSMLNRGWVRTIRLYLKECRQFEPLGENLPVRHPVTKEIISTPFRYPIGEFLDNFRISLHAADDAVARERDRDQVAILIDVYHKHAAFAMEAIGPMMSAEITEKQADVFLQLVKGDQKLFDLIIGPTRSDVENFNIVPYLDRLLEEKARLLEEQKAATPPQIEGGAVNGLPVPTAPANPGAPVPPGAAPATGGTPPVGVEPGMAGSDPLGPGDLAVPADPQGLPPAGV
ncbi:MAG: hypothetical protein WC538_22210 [Thermoanaerobaculia bacterium]